MHINGNTPKNLKSNLKSMRMGIYMYLLCFFLLSSSFFSLSNAISEDEVGKYDLHYFYRGLSCAADDGLSIKCRGRYCAVLAADIVSVNDRFSGGDLIWRKRPSPNSVFVESQIDGHTLVTLDSNGMLRRWRLFDGILVWEADVGSSGDIKQDDTNLAIYFVKYGGSPYVFLLQNSSLQVIGYTSGTLDGSLGYSFNNTCSMSIIFGKTSFFLTCLSEEEDGGMLRIISICFDSKSVDVVSEIQLMDTLNIGSESSQTSCRSLISVASSGSTLLLCKGTSSAMVMLVADDGSVNSIELPEEHSKSKIEMVFGANFFAVSSSENLRSSLFEISKEGSAKLMLDAELILPVMSTRTQFPSQKVVSVVDEVKEKGMSTLKVMDLESGREHLAHELEISSPQGKNGKTVRHPVLMLDSSPSSRSLSSGDTQSQPSTFSIFNCRSDASLTHVLRNGMGVSNRWSYPEFLSRTMSAHYISMTRSTISSRAISPFTKRWNGELKYQIPMLNADKRVESSKCGVDMDCVLLVHSNGILSALDMREGGLKWSLDLSTQLEKRTRIYVRSSEMIYDSKLIIFCHVEEGSTGNREPLAIFFDSKLQKIEIAMHLPRHVLSASHHSHISSRMDIIRHEVGPVGKNVGVSTSVFILPDLGTEAGALCSTLEPRLRKGDEISIPMAVHQECSNFSNYMSKIKLGIPCEGMIVGLRYVPDSLEKVDEYYAAKWRVKFIRKIKGGIVANILPGSDSRLHHPQTPVSGDGRMRFSAANESHSFFSYPMKHLVAYVIVGESAVSVRFYSLLDGLNLHQIELKSTPKGLDSPLSARLISQSVTTFHDSKYISHFWDEELKSFVAVSADILVPFPLGSKDELIGPSKMQRPMAVDSRRTLDTPIRSICPIENDLITGKYVLGLVDGTILIVDRPIFTDRKVKLNIANSIKYDLPLLPSEGISVLPMANPSAFIIISHGERADLFLSTILPGGSFNYINEKFLGKKWLLVVLVGAMLLGTLFVRVISRRKSVGKLWS